MGTHTFTTRFPTSISDDISTYQHLLSINSPYTIPFHQQILARLQNEPVTELDVQALWAIESPEWIDALLANIVKFDVLSSQPKGGYVHLFIETEMMRYEHGAAKWLVDVYERHKRVVREEKKEKRKARFRKAVGSFVAKRIERLMEGAW
ncbi:hypothetical protein yc1106_05491 [Curvularia clavata]|uniref:Uncharacterized protein n=1 Tax=Curvularia clavata TaxID=95742 RepID=A0A9Q9DSY4_CURCL|nr:hypothetical protein yc1106_05491 [Curvularia clavata]